MSNINSQVQRNNSDVPECPSQQESLFVSLSPEAAAAVTGGGSFGFSARFDYLFRTGIFKVRPGGSIVMSSGTSSTPTNRLFNATIFNVDTKRTSSKIVSVGRATTVWNGVRGGNYRILLSDTRDGQYVSGTFGVGYTS